MKRNNSNSNLGDATPNKVALVNRNMNPFVLVEKLPLNLVLSAIKIRKADDLIVVDACNKVQAILQQRSCLREEAQKVFQATRVNAVLHNAACNFVKVPGNIYHLYKKPTDQHYFSMLSPQEWINPPHEYLGSFRYRSDHSWIPIDSIQSEDANISLINKILISSKKLNAPITK